MQAPIILEICADSVESAIAAQEAGADRIELCANLAQGGTTPSAASIELARKYLRIPLHVLIRPRNGDFLYSSIEFDTMLRDIEMAKNLGADGIVCGALTAEGDIDRERTARLIAASRPLSFTFHRAFDMVADPHRALHELLALGVDRLLTSGLAPTAPEGEALLRELVELAGNRMVIMPGGGVHEKTIARLREATGAREFHSSAKGSQSSRMQYRNPAVAMGSNSEEYHWSIVDPARVRAIRQATG